MMAVVMKSGISQLQHTWWCGFLAGSDLASWHLWQNDCYGWTFSEQSSPQKRAGCSLLSMNLHFPWHDQKSTLQMCTQGQLWQKGKRLYGGVRK